MSAQRAEVHWARYLDGNRRVVLEADHARIVAEATAEARAAERRHWEARFRNAEQAHATALADANGYRCDCVGEHDGGCNQDYYAWQQIGREAAAPRTLTADDPEPAVVSVVLDKDGIAGQRVYTDDGVTTIWQFSDDDWCHKWGTVDRVRGPVTLIHDGGAA